MHPGTTCDHDGGGPSPHSAAARDAADNGAPRRTVSAAITARSRGASGIRPSSSVSAPRTRTSMGPLCARLRHPSRRLISGRYKPDRRRYPADTPQSLTDRGATALHGSGRFDRVHVHSVIAAVFGRFRLASGRLRDIADGAPLAWLSTGSGIRSGPRLQNHDCGLGRPKRRKVVQPRVDLAPPGPETRAFVSMCGASVHEAPAVANNNHRIRLGLDAEPPCRLRVGPTVHGHRDEVRTVFEVAEDHLAVGVTNPGCCNAVVDVTQPFRLLPPICRPSRACARSGLTRRAALGGFRGRPSGLLRRRGVPPRRG